MKNIKLAFLLLLIAIPCMPADYELNKDEDIRFGIPGKNCLIINREGFISCYDTQRKAPSWVSYTLKKEFLKKNVKMAPGYMPDTKIPEAQRVDMPDYDRRGQYELTRMAPIKDMLRSKEVMFNTHYFTNICLMYYGLNRGLWRELEDNVRKFAQKKSQVWVIAGPIFSAKGRKNDNLGILGVKRINIPTHFYKIVVYQAEDFGFNACSFIFPNNETEGGLADYSVSVTQVEDMTGLDFFHILPDDVQKLMKAKPATQEQLDYLFMVPAKKPEEPGAGT